MFEGGMLIPQRTETGAVHTSVLNKIAEFTKEIVKLQKKNDRLQKLTLTFTVVTAVIALASFIVSLFA